MAHRPHNRSTRKAPSLIPGKVRIIAGLWRHRQLSVLPFSGLRPTPDRVRETLFNWLSPDLQGASCLDLFAGSGALGFEAASRGAEQVVLIERDVHVARNLQQQADRLGAHMVQIVCADATDWIFRTKQCFDVVFVDPPYGTVELLPLMSTLHRDAHVHAASKVYAEVPADDARPIFPRNWSLLREKRAGRVRYTLATPTNKPVTGV